MGEQIAFLIQFRLVARSSDGKKFPGVITFHDGIYVNFDLKSCIFVIVCESFSKVPQRYIFSVDAQCVGHFISQMRDEMITLKNIYILLVFKLN